jgi:hypothetical protein
MMLTLITLASLLAAFPQVTGHGGGMFYTIDGVKYTGYVHHAATLHKYYQSWKVGMQRMTIAESCAVHSLTSATMRRGVFSVIGNGTASTQ